MSKYNEESKRLLEYIGGKENIISVTHCATRLRFALVDDKKADIKKIGELETVKGTFVNAGQFQVIIGNDVADFYKTFINTAGLETASKAEVKKEALKKQSFIQKMIAHLAEIFVPLLPAIIAGGLILGFRNILGDMKVFGDGTQSLTELHAWAATLNDFLWWFGNAIFPFLPALVAWSTVKKFGGTEVLGVVLGIMLVSPEFFMNAYQYGSLAVDHAALTEALEKGNYIWHIFGLNIAKVGYQAQVLPAIFSGITLCYIEKWFTKRVPEILKLVVVPFMALFITGILTVTIIGPAAREIGNYIALIFKTLMLTPGLKYLGGFAFGLLYAPLVVTGLHHTFLAVDFQLIADPSLQGTMIWPMIALSNIAQSGAVAATYFIYKQRQKTGITFGFSNNISMARSYRAGDVRGKSEIYVSFHSSNYSFSSSRSDFGIFRSTGRRCGNRRASGYSGNKGTILAWLYFSYGCSTFWIIFSYLCIQKDI